MRYRIGSFNLKNFGAYADFGSADAPRRDFDKIAQIIREEDLDVVAFQEILSGGKGLQRLLEQYVNAPWHPWDFCWAAPRESSDPTKRGKDMRGEGYAYIWNKRKFRKSASQSILAKKNIWQTIMTILLIARNFRRLQTFPARRLMQFQNTAEEITRITTTTYQTTFRF